jgi:hypothetical protein
MHHIGLIFDMLFEMVASVFRKKKMKAKPSYTDIGSFAA